MARSTSERSSHSVSDGGMSTRREGMAHSVNGVAEKSSQLSPLPTSDQVAGKTDSDLSDLGEDDGKYHRSGSSSDPGLEQDGEDGHDDESVVDSVAEPARRPADLLGPGTRRSRRMGSNSTTSGVGGHRTVSRRTSLSDEPRSEDDPATSETERLSQLDQMSDLSDEDQEQYTSMHRAPRLGRGSSRRRSDLSSELSDPGSWANRHTDEDLGEGRHQSVPDYEDPGDVVGEEQANMDHDVEEEVRMEEDDVEEGRTVDGEEEAVEDGDGDGVAESFSEEATIKEVNDTQDNTTTEIPSARTPKGKPLAISRSRHDLLPDQEDAGQEAEDEETPGATPAASVHEDEEDEEEEEGPHTDRQAALESLRTLEEAFNLVKETLMIQKFRHFDWEIEKIQSDDHPDVPSIDKLLKKRRDERISAARTRLSYTTRLYQNVFLSESHQAKCAFVYGKARLRKGLMEEYSRKRRKVEGERRAYEVPRPVREPPSQAALNHINLMKAFEVEAAKDIISRFGWPSAPGVPAIRPDEATEDLIALGLYSAPQVTSSRSRQIHGAFGNYKSMDTGGSIWSQQPGHLHSSMSGGREKDINRLYSANHGGMPVAPQSSHLHRHHRTGPSAARLNAATQNLERRQASHLELMGQPEEGYWEDVQRDRAYADQGFSADPMTIRDHAARSGHGDMEVSDGGAPPPLHDITVDRTRTLKSHRNHKNPPKRSRRYSDSLVQSPADYSNKDGRDIRAGSSSPDMQYSMHLQGHHRPTTREEADRFLEPRDPIDSFWTKPDLGHNGQSSILGQVDFDEDRNGGFMPPPPPPPPFTTMTKSRHDSPEHMHRRISIVGNPDDRENAFRAHAMAYQGRKERVPDIRSANHSNGSRQDFAHYGRPGGDHSQDPMTRNRHFSPPPLQTLSHTPFGYAKNSAPDQEEFSQPNYHHQAHQPDVQHHYYHGNHYHPEDHQKQNRQNYHYDHARARTTPNDYGGDSYHNDTGSNPILTQPTGHHVNASI